MISEDGVWIECNEPGCTSKIKNHRWGKIKAEDWFFEKYDDIAWCPNHIPDWVAKWRKRKAKEAADKDDIPIEELGLTVRINNLLMSEGITTIGMLRERLKPYDPPHDLSPAIFYIRGIGFRSCDMIEAYLDRWDDENK